MCSLMARMECLGTLKTWTYFVLSQTSCASTGSNEANSMFLSLFPSSRSPHQELDNFEPNITACLHSFTWPETQLLAQFFPPQMRNFVLKLCGRRTHSCSFVLAVRYMVPCEPSVVRVESTFVHTVVAPCLWEIPPTSFLQPTVPHEEYTGNIRRRVFPSSSRAVKEADETRRYSWIPNLSTNKLCCTMAVTR